MLWEEFADVDFNEERLEKRFRQTMETLSKDPRKSIYGGSRNRAEAKAIYNLPGNDKFNTSEILGDHRAATIRRMEGRSLILAARDTAPVIMTAGGRWKAADTSATRPWGKISIAARQ
jgi:hypothetical protein